MKRKSHYEGEGWMYLNKGYNNNEGKLPQLVTKQFRKVYTVFPLIERQPLFERHPLLERQSRKNKTTCRSIRGNT